MRQGVQDSSEFDSPIFVLFLFAEGDWQQPLAPPRLRAGCAGVRGSPRPRECRERSAGALRGAGRSPLPPVAHSLRLAGPSEGDADTVRLEWAAVPRVGTPPASTLARGGGAEKVGGHVCGLLPPCA